MSDRSDRFAFDGPRRNETGWWSASQDQNHTSYCKTFVSKFPFRLLLLLLCVHHWALFIIIFFNVVHFVCFSVVSRVFMLWRLFHFLVVFMLNGISLIHRKRKKRVMLCLDSKKNTLLTKKEKKVMLSNSIKMELYMMPKPFSLSSPPLNG